VTQEQFLVFTITPTIIGALGWIFAQIAMRNDRKNR
jgi:hypothetical protein